MIERVCAVVVTFNRKVLLAECLSGLRGQTRKLDHVLVIDNKSTDGTSEFVKDEFPDVELVAMMDNLGGAGGFHEGVRRAYDAGYDWIWLMDDDAEPTPSALEKLLAAVPTDVVAGAGSKEVLALCPLIHGVHANRVQSNHHKFITRFFQEKSLAPGPTKSRCVPIDADAFVGPLFSREGVRLLGFPRAEYFLWVDDLEYTYRFSQQGACILVADAIILHKDRPAFTAPIKLYYGHRNYVDFVLRRATKAARDRNNLPWRVFVGVLLRALMSSRHSAALLRASFRKGSGIRPSEALFPILGFIHGVLGRAGKY